MVNIITSFTSLCYIFWCRPRPASTRPVIEWDDAVCLPQHPPWPQAIVSAHGWGGTTHVRRSRPSSPSPDGGRGGATCSSWRRPRPPSPHSLDGRDGAARSSQCLPQPPLPSPACEWGSALRLVGGTALCATHDAGRGPRYPALLEGGAAPRFLHGAGRGSCPPPSWWRAGWRRAFFTAPSTASFPPPF